MSDQQFERRLAAILFADVAGYSRLMSEDEEGALRRLQEHRYALIDPTIGQFRGRIVKSLGDGLLVEFRSVVEAVRCGVALQKGMAARNEKRPDGPLIRLRIGVNLGEVLVEDDDIFGDGVNVAARLEQLAEPGGVAITSAVLAQVEGELEEHFADLGAHQVKNIAKPLRVYHYNPAPAEKSAKQAFRPFVDLPGEEEALITGGCLCGAVRYEINEPALGSMYCQCRICQRFSGAPIVAGTTFPTEAISFTKEEPTYYASSPIAERGFCVKCGSPIAYRGTLGQWTKWMLIFSASLDHPENFTPTYHLGVESAMPWLNIEDDLPRTRCEDSPSLRQAWDMAKKQGIV